MIISDVIKSKLSCISGVDIESILIYNNKNTIQIKSSVNCIVNLEKMNNFRYINKVHEYVNRSLSIGNFYVTCVETYDHRMASFSNKFSLKPVYKSMTALSFLFQKVVHKVAFINKLYFIFTNGKDRPLSKVEALGRVVSCGFEIEDVFEFDGLLYIISKKVDAPHYDMNASFSLFIRMKRVGHKGKIIYVYKMRTMYPFSEYLQSYIIKENKLHKNGKINNDYRITSWGKFIRKYWIDELPMIINFFKGELNIVGVRPLSQDYFNRYPKHLQKLRVRVKPGLIPPYYADMPNSLDEVLESEEEYILSKLKNPLKTDWIYFWKAINNIFFKGARSK